MDVKATIRVLTVLAVMGSNIGCDQVSKNIARQKLEYHEEVSLANNEANGSVED